MIPMNSKEFMGIIGNSKGISASHDQEARDGDPVRGASRNSAAGAWAEGVISPLVAPPRPYVDS